MTEKEPLCPREIPQHPFEYIGVDIATHKGKKYLVVVDAFSFFPMVDRMYGEETKDVRMILKSTLHGSAFLGRLQAMRVHSLFLWSCMTSYNII